MKNLFKYIAINVFLVLGVSSCTDHDEFINPEIEEGIPTEVKLYFGTSTPKIVESRAVVETDDEVYTIDVFVFNSDGSFCSHTADSPRREQKGEVIIQTKTGKGKTIYAIANLNASNYPGQREAIIEEAKKGKETFLNATVTMNKTVTIVDGYFPMSGFLAKSDKKSEPLVCDITTEGIFDGQTKVSSSDDYYIYLTRLVSDITFNIIGPSGNNNNTFIPRSWKVVNVPSISNLIEKTSDANGATETYFSGSNAGENLPSTMKSTDTSFSFYMMENLKTSTTVPPTLKDRFIYKTTENGNTVPDENRSSYLPTNATYVELKGYFEGTANKYPHDSETGQYIYGENVNTDESYVEANVTYYIPLGDINSSLDNYKTERNAKYIYNVKIKGVNDIVVEVVIEDNETTIADGDVHYVPGADNVLTFDSHYATDVISFPLSGDSRFLYEQFDYRIKTPYTNGVYADGMAVETGSKVRVDDSGWREKHGVYTIDCGGSNWVHFALNNNDGASTEEISYAEALKGNNLLTFSQLREKLKVLQEYNPKRTVNFTIFVDEFYYKTKGVLYNYSSNTPSADLLAGTGDAPDWNTFVGSDKEYREFLILDRTVGPINGSTLTEAKYVIRQKPIQTIYRTDEGHTTAAWGVEWVNETAVAQSPNGKGSTSWNDGRRNMIKDLNLTSNSLQITWSTDNLKTHPSYACMTRNRDLNGDGKITENEVKWYLPAINQYQDSWVGLDALDKNAHFYQYTDGSNYVSTHYYSNTKNGDFVYAFWAEEGCAISGRGDYGSNVEIRCARNLNIAYTTESIKATEPYSNGVQFAVLDENTINLSGLNSSALRDYIENDLPLHAEYDLQNKVSAIFQYDEDYKQTTIGRTWYNLIGDNNGIEGEKYCAEGYRLPNQRELILMATKAGMSDVTVPVLGKTLSIYYQTVFNSEDIKLTDMDIWGYPYNSTPNYWIGGYILNPWEHGVTVQTGDYYFGTTVKAYWNYLSDISTAPNDCYYYIRCVKDIQ